MTFSRQSPLPLTQGGVRVGRQLIALRAKDVADIILIHEVKYQVGFPSVRTLTCP